MKLMIVESPKKTEKIKGFLDDGWEVVASKGHVRDLPVREIGVAAPDFRPKYVPTEHGAKTISWLASKAAKAEAVYLAADPDREGEAIAWHIADALKLKNPIRVTFAEITEKAVKAALKVPRPIDMNLVAAQEGRRVLDRLCGYLVSPALNNVLGVRASAGRVQSPALRLFTEREAEIENFKPTTHYGAVLTFGTADDMSKSWRATWLSKPWLEDGQEYIKDKALVDRVAALRTLEVVDYKETEERKAPPAPLTTSTLQQVASKRLKMPIKKIMELAQRLYEGGHISYIRTDSPNLSAEAVESIRNYCEQQGWPLVLSPRTWTAKNGAQEAHEAIRPTKIELEDCGDTPEEKTLYELIRIRTLATQLEDSVYSVRVLQLKGDFDGKEVVFESRGRVLLSPGWEALYARIEQNAETEDDKNSVPALMPGSQVTAANGELQTKQTQPPSRFTEGTLVSQLEKMGIGRPATYVAIINKLYEKEYAREAKGKLVPTELGKQVISCLAGRISFLDYAFTRNLEQDLDDIANGTANYRDVVQAAHEQLQQELVAFAKTTGKICALCGKPMRHIVKAPSKGKKGMDFWGCTGFPECRGKPVE